MAMQASNATQASTTHTTHQTFQSAENHRMEDIENYLRTALANATDFVVSISVQRTVPLHALLKPWDNEAEKHELKRTLLAYYVAMLSITKTEYNDDTLRQSLLKKYIKRHGVKAMMDVLRCLLDALTKNEIPAPWRMHFPEPDSTLVFIKDDIQYILSNDTYYHDYFHYEPLVPKPEAKTEPKPEPVVPPEAPKPEPKTEPAPNVPQGRGAVQELAKPVRLRSFGYSIGLNDATSRVVLQRAVETAGFYNVLAKMEFLLRVWDKYPCMTYLTRDHAFVLSLRA